MNTETTEHYLQLFNVIEFMDAKHIRYALPEEFSIKIVKEKTEYVSLKTLWDSSNKVFTAETLDNSTMEITLIARYTDMALPWSNKPITEISQGNFNFQV